MQLTIDNEPTIISTGVFAFEKPLISAENTSGLYYHLVFRSSEDLDAIGESARKDFYGFIFGCAASLQGTIESIGGRGDSVHLLVSLGRTQNPADFVKKIKLFTAARARRKLDLPDFFWLDIDVSTVSQSHRWQITSYIQSQNFLF